jgi:hypothetical protein
MGIIESFCYLKIPLLPPIFIECIGWNQPDCANDLQRPAEGGVISPPVVRKKIEPNQNDGL